MPNILNTRALRQRQTGFTLIELTLVLLVIAVLGLLVTPQIRAYMIDGRVDPTAKDLVQAVTRIRANAIGQGQTPYATVATATLANTLRDRSTALTITGTGNSAVVTHGLGATGATVVMAPGTITSAGDSMVVTFNAVANAACPGLATQLQNTAEIVAVNSTTVKSIPASTAYSGQVAQDACTAGDNNTFVFTFR